MTPKVARSGRSFKGAARYYLHDKGADTSDRVVFTETVNLPTNDVRRATAHMIDTASHAAQLKQAAGIKGGRPSEKPVYAYSLSWHPSEKPSREEQLKAAHETIKLLGLADRQAMIIGHGDTDHIHVHVIVNKVCPETGRSAVFSNDQVILSQWALEYERQRGEIFCKKREENKTRRDRGEWVKDDSPNRRQHYEWKKAQTDKLWSQYREERKSASAERRAQYDALWRRKEEGFVRLKDEIRQTYKPLWNASFKRQRDVLGRFDSKLSERISFAMSRPTGKLFALVQAVLSSDGLRRKLIHQQEEERRRLGEIQAHAIYTGGQEIKEAWQRDRDNLKIVHKEQDAARLQDYEERSKKVRECQNDGQKVAANFNEQAHRRDSLEAFFGGDKEAVKKTRNKQERQRERNKERNRTRKREQGGREMEP